MLKHLHLMVFCAIVALFCSGYFIYKELNKSGMNKQFVNDISVQQQYLDLPEIFLHSPPLVVSEKNVYTDTDILDEYRDAYGKNNDLAGWLNIDDVVSLPIMYTPSDPEFYLTHDVNESEKKHGALFMDARCSFNSQSDNIIIHGHNMNDKTMFSSLMNYKKDEFYKKHKKIQFNTLYEKNEYEVFAAFISTFNNIEIVENNYFNAINFASKDEFDFFVSEIEAQSLHKSTIKPKYGDSFITLMTCTNQDDDERMTVIAVKNSAD